MTGMGPEAALLSARLADLRSLRTPADRDRLSGVSIYAAACTPIGSASDLRTSRPFSGDWWSRCRAAFRALSARIRRDGALPSTAKAPFESGGAIDPARPIFAVPAVWLNPRGAARQTDAARVPMAGLPACRDQSR